MYSLRAALLLMSSLGYALLVSGGGGLGDAISTARGTTAAPAPIVVQPSQHFEGNDGSWSTFDLRVGTPPQYVRALVSTASPETIVVLSEGCLKEVFNDVSVPTDCAVSRGAMFNASASTTWLDQGNYALNHDGAGLEANLGYSQTMDMGLDTLGIGLVAGANAPTLTNQTMAGVVYPSPFYIGTFGLNTEPVNFTSLGNTSTPSFLVSLKTQKMIPSLSWSYTAGAIYRLKKVGGQLIFGGYDASRFVANSVTFTMADDTTRDLVVSLQSVSYSGSTQASLLDSPINIFIDSTDPFLWLPESACKRFESAFGLTLDSKTGFYLVNDTHRSQLQASNAEVTFQLSDGLDGGASTTVILPYEAFDLQMGPPLLGNSSSYYFPLRQAANESQFTLGRTFLQEAYLTADYERRRFNVSQCSWVEGANQQIVPILSIEDDLGSNKTSPTSSPSSTPSSSPSQEPMPNQASMSTAATVGIVIGAIAVVAALAGAIFFFLRRRKIAAGNTNGSTNGIPPPSNPFEEPAEVNWPEDDDGLLKLEATRPSPFSELSNEGSIHQLETYPKATPVSELGDGSEVRQLDGKTQNTGGQARPDAHELEARDVAQVFELSGSDALRAELEDSVALRSRKGSSAAHSAWER